MKTGHIGYTKVLLGYAFCGVTDPVCIEQAKSLCYKFGYLCQVQNDFTDCYGDPKDIGKVGTDIEEGKCTWLAIKFLEVASTDQKKIFKENYGKTDPLCVTRIKQLYDEVSMKISEK
uniref:Polyprenyl synthetase n=1 Tax=Phlebotomus papatasi TaxID=29031 RepID=A0A1B0DNH6_PHLPP